MNESHVHFLLKKALYGWRLTSLVVPRNTCQLFGDSLVGVSVALAFDGRDVIPTLKALHLLARGVKRVPENTC